MVAFAGARIGGRGVDIEGGSRRYAGVCAYTPTPLVLQLTDFDTDGHHGALDDYTTYADEDHEDDEPGVIEVGKKSG